MLAWQPLSECRIKRFFYLSSHDCNLRQLYDIRPNGVEHVLKLVYDGNKRLHLSYFCLFKQIKEPFGDGAKVIQCPSVSTIATRPARWTSKPVGSCSSMRKQNNRSKWRINYHAACWKLTRWFVFSRMRTFVWRRTARWLVEFCL